MAPQRIALIRCMGGRFCVHRPGECTATRDVVWERPFVGGAVKIDHDAIIARMKLSDDLATEHFERILEVERSWGAKAAIAEAIAIGLAHKETQA